MRADRLLIGATIIAAVALTVWGYTIGNYPTSANIFPALAAAGITLFGLAAMREDSPDDADEFSWKAVAWLLAVLPLIYLFGFRIALPLYALIYALAHRAGLLVSIACALGVTATIEILFVRILTLPLEWGWLIRTVF